MTGVTAKTGREWIAQFAAELGVDPPDDALIDALLDLAGTAAHSSERIAAPIACYLLGRAGRTPVDGEAAAARVGSGSS